MSIIFVHSANGQIHEDGVDYYKDWSTNYVYSHAPKGHPDSLFVGKANKIPPLQPFLRCWYSLNLTSTLSNAQQRLDNQKDITDEASLLAKDLEVRRDEARIALKKAEKINAATGETEPEYKGPQVDVSWSQFKKTKIFCCLIKMIIK